MHFQGTVAFIRIMAGGFIAPGPGFRPGCRV